MTIAGLGQHSRIGCEVGPSFDRKVRAEEVMIDDDDVALGRAAPHLGNEATVELLTLRADAAIGARVELAP